MRRPGNDPPPSLLEEMASYRRKTTGVANVVFISSKGRTRHAARIAVAIEAPDSVDPRNGVAWVDIATGAVVAGHVDPVLLAQLRAFIDLNRATLLAYWNYKISTAELHDRLRSINRPG